MSVSWQQVDSTFIKELGWDEEDEMAYARFHDGAEFKYGPMDQSEYDDWRNAPSIGKHFHQVIKKRFKGVRV